MGLNKVQQGWVKAAAASSGYAYPLLAALVDKESGGNFYWQVGAARVLALNIEGHYFYKYLALLAPDKLKEAVRTGLAAKQRGVVKVPSSYSGRYAMLNRMIALNEDAAYRSISSGVGQVMGDNYKAMDFDSAKALFQFGTVSGQNQIELMIRFIATKPALVTAMHAEDTSQIAYYYNGPAYRTNHYDTDLDQLIKVYSGEASDPIDNSVPAVKALGYSTVEQFQAENGLKPDGKVGDITRKKILEVQEARAAVKAQPRKTATKVVGGLAIAGMGGAGLVQNAQTITDATDAVKPVLDVVQQASYVGPLAVGVIVAIILGVSIYVWWKSRKVGTA